jgi:hypothetical protein
MPRNPKSDVVFLWCQNLQTTHTAQKMIQAAAAASGMD